MLLSSVLEGVRTLEISGGTGMEITSVEYDSRRVKKGGMFVAVKGTKADGNRFIGMGVTNGAVAVMHQDYEGERAPGVTFVRVPDAREAMARAAANLYGRPSERLKVAGITGTNGKTTTSYLVRSVLEAGGEGVGLIGTISYSFGGRTMPAPNTTPESADLQRMLGEMADAGARYAVVEVSSHAVALKRIAACGFAVKVFTNFTQDHLDFHGSMEEYFAAKKSFFTGWGGTSVVNMDDPRGPEIAASSAGGVITYGINTGADVTAADVELRPDGLSFTMRAPADSVRIGSPLVGRHNVYNILAASTACIALGVELQTIAQGIRDMKEVPGRLERVDAGQGYAVLVDYAHTEDALERALATAREFTSGRLITVFGCGGDRDRGKRPKMGRAAARLSDVVIVTSDNPRTEDPAAIIAEVEAGVMEEGAKVRGEDYFAMPDRLDAIKLAVGMARDGDTVLIAGKGHEDYQIVGENKHHFDDRLAARQAVMDRGRG